eukprot:TRINITY_DN2005_c0_g2_i1.p1 TRINITY_DN2005_c0_g2~~TRINITY_DN2005_c0_g2_i1.p1  ORF type:complete len:206 (+),score=3.56 TRINITY_DN2005_c0_g2_i1:132-749(+)
MSCSSYMQGRVCANAVQSLAPEAKRCGLSDGFLQQETHRPGFRRPARYSLARRLALGLDSRNCFKVQGLHCAEARKSGRVRCNWSQVRAPSVGVAGAISRISEASVAKKSCKGRLQFLQGSTGISGLRLQQVHRNRALETPRRHLRNAVQGGDTQGNRGATDRDESTGPERSRSEETEGEEGKLEEKEESVTEKLLREMREKAEE